MSDIYPGFNCNNVFGSEKKCKVCSKRFIASGEWVFKREFESKTIFFCSWKCLRAFEKEHPYPGNVGNRYGKEGNIYAKEIIKMLKQGHDTPAIREELGVPESTVIYYRRKLLQEKAKARCEA